jgi:hypothetical protein
MPPRTGPPTKTSPHHVAVRIDAELLARIDALVDGLSSRWHRATRSDALRLVMIEGLRTIEARKAHKKGGRS